ncbi:MAG: DUF3365 domain-containing protein [candidate division Zixibacteria bacterium]|nr:DUF3365 domain-containing protein [candidate division Zixibacteria bacterium]
MKRGLIIIAVAAIAAGCIQRIDRRTDGFDEKKVAAACELLITSFQKELTQELVKAMTAGGPENAIKVCAVKAPEIADRISQMPGIDIRRVSLQMRNPNIVPDRYEFDILRQFATTSHEEPRVASVLVRDSGDVKRFRYMKEIKTGQLCLSCHGNPNGFSFALKKALRDKYPGDRAVGYRIGDSRGAFSLTVTYPDAQATVIRLLTENSR